jgi:hypothetical protein
MAWISCTKKGDIEEEKVQEFQIQQETTMHWKIKEQLIFRNFHLTNIASQRFVFLFCSIFQFHLRGIFISSENIFGSTNLSVINFSLIKVLKSHILTQRQEVMPANEFVFFNRNVKTCKVLITTVMQTVCYCINKF